MNYRISLLFVFMLGFEAFAQKSQVQLAQNSVGKLQVGIAAKADLKKQLSIIGEGSRQ
ncbi:hypothetical protein [Pedobacter sp. UC225_65]|uniref:hypothetical protein n=1 Tax=Pedobacter sp. UC225_65 TaxID=3350173 RepID=UPI00367121A9